MGKPYTDDRKEEDKATLNEIPKKKDLEKFNNTIPDDFVEAIVKLNISDYANIDRQIKELTAKRDVMKPGIIDFMKKKNLRILGKLTLVITEKQKLDATKIYKFLGFKKFMTIAKVTLKDSEQYLSKLDIGKCYDDKEVEPEFFLRVNHNSIN